MTELSLPPASVPQEVSTSQNGIQQAFEALPEVIEEESSAEDATALIVTISKLIKEVDAQRTELVKPLNEHVKNINKKFKPISDGLGQIKAEINQRLSSYHVRQQAKAQQEAARLKKLEEDAMLEVAAKAEAEGDAEFANEIMAAAADGLANRTAEKVMTRTEAGSAHMRSTWKFIVENLKEVPFEYLTVDEKAVKAAIKSGERKIQGLKIYNELQTIVRG